MKKIYAVLTEAEFKAMATKIYENNFADKREHAIEQFFIGALSETAERANVLLDTNNYLPYLVAKWKSYSTNDMRDAVMVKAEGNARLIAMLNARRW